MFKSAVCRQLNKKKKNNGEKTVQLGDRRLRSIGDGRVARTSPYTEVAAAAAAAAAACVCALKMKGEEEKGWQPISIMESIKSNS